MVAPADPTTRVIGLFAILFASVAGVALPSIVHRVATGRWPGGQHRCGEPTNGKDAATSNASSGEAEPLARRRGWRFSYLHVVKLLAALGCGCVLATALIHLAPDAAENLDTHGGYPSAFAIATGAVVLLYVVEKELTLRLQRAQHARSREHARLRHKQRRASAAAAIAAAAKHQFQQQQQQQQQADSLERPIITDGSGVPPSSDGCACVHVPEADTAAQPSLLPAEDALEVDECTDSKLIRAIVAVHVLEIGIAVHSVIIGFAYGMLRGQDEARSLAIALCFHQFCEGAAIGAAVMESRLTQRHTWFMWAIFAVTTPLGAAIGLLVEQYGTSEIGPSGVALQGVLSAVATGILLYMALVDMLPRAMTLPAPDDADDDAPSDRCGVNRTVTRHRNTRGHGHSHGHHHYHHHHSEDVVPVSPASSASKRQRRSVAKPIDSAAVELYGGTDAAVDATNAPHTPAADAPVSTGDSSVSATDDSEDLLDVFGPPGWYRAAVYTLVAFGASVMAILAIWA